jgi:hypothetical protein
MPRCLARALPSAERTRIVARSSFATALKIVSKNSASSLPGPGSVREIGSHPRAAVVIKPVSTDSLPKTGIFADKAGDFR